VLGLRSHSYLRRVPCADPHARVRRHRSPSALVLALTASLALVVPAPLSAGAEPEPSLPAVPTPEVNGPVPSRPSNQGNDYTFFSYDLDLQDRGYVEEEFFYSGSANVYDATVAGGIGACPTPSTTANVVSSNHDYTTRMVVDRQFFATRPNQLRVADFVRHEALLNRVEVRDHHRPAVAAAE
jgi:hypothetical protein